MSTVADAGSPVVTAVGIGLSYGSVRVLAGVNLTVARGAELAIMGRSGSGKTSLLLLLAGLFEPDLGEVTWPGLDPRPAGRRTQIGMVFQAPSLLPELTAAENIALPLRLRGTGGGPAGAATRAALDVLGLADAADALPAELSGGMQQRVAIARVLAAKPRLVLADEPTGALDRATAARSLAALRDQLRADGGALVLATHDEELADLLPGRAIISDGKVQVRAPTGRAST